MKRFRLVLLALTGFFALTLAAQAKPNARIERRHRRRDQRIERVTKLRHHHTPWYRVDKHIKITMDALKLKRANKRITKRARHKKADQHRQFRKQRRDRIPGWRVGFGVGMSQWH